MPLNFQKRFQSSIVQTETIKMTQIQEKAIIVAQNVHKLKQSKHDTKINQTDQNQLNSCLIQQDNKVSKWMNRQKLRYLIFLTFYQKQLQGENLQPKSKMYSIMSEIIGDLDKQNCRTHQRNFLQRFKTIERIINYFKISVSYKIQSLQQQIKRAVNIIIEQQNKKHKELYQLFEKKLTNKNCKIIKHEPINHEVKISIKPNTQQDKKILAEESQNPKASNIVIIPVELLIILKRQTYFRDINLIRQTQLIDQCITNFKNNKEKVYKRRIVRFKNKKAIIVPNLQKKSKPIHKANLNDTQLFSQENSSISDKSNNIQQINNNTQYPQLYEKRKGLYIWKKKEVNRLIIFLLIMKEYRQKYNLNQIPYLNKKCSQYINTDKNFYDCSQKILRLKKKYGKQFWNMIDKQAEKRSIPESLIEMEKQKYFYYLNNPPSCQVKVQCKSLKKSQSQQFNELKLDERIWFEFKKTEQKLNKENNNHSLMKSEKIKQVVHMQLSNQIFGICRNSLKNTLYKRLNYILLVRKTQQIIQLVNNQ